MSELVFAELVAEEVAAEVVVIELVGEGLRMVVGRRAAGHFDRPWVLLAILQV